MPSNQEILQRVSALVPDAGQNEPDQHVVVWVPVTLSHPLTWCLLLDQ
jgi:hypothetical protein